MAEETETTTRYYCDICKEEIENFSSKRNKFEGIIICEECREGIRQLATKDDFHDKLNPLMEQLIERLRNWEWREALQTLKAIKTEVSRLDMKDKKRQLQREKERRQNRAKAR